MNLVADQEELYYFQGMSKLTLQKSDNENQLLLVNKVMDRLAQVIDETDEQTAADKVAEIRAANPDAELDELADLLIMTKCRETAVVGATTSGMSLIPGLGTLMSLTVGIAADFGITFKLQAELVLELAHLYGHAMNPEEKRRVVMLVTGFSAGTTAVAHRAGKHVSKRVTARVASKYVTRVVPVVGMAASASTNAVMTYYIGKRAQDYFLLTPEEMQAWGSVLPAITGLDRSIIANGARAGKLALTKAGTTAVSGAKNGARSILSRRKSSPQLPESQEIFVIDMSQETN